MRANAFAFLAGNLTVEIAEENVEILSDRVPKETESSPIEHQAVIKGDLMLPFGMPRVPLNQWDYKRAIHIGLEVVKPIILK